MKANAPEKIYIHPNIGGREFLIPWLKIRVSPESVEYTQTDAFIDRATEWLNNFYNEDTHSYLINEDIEKFINYMKGE